MAISYQVKSLTVEKWLWLPALSPFYGDKMGNSKTFGVLCLSSAVGLSLYWTMYLMGNFPRMVQFGLNMPEVYTSTGVIGAVCVALFTIGIVSLGAKPAKSVKGLMLVRNAEGKVVSIMESEGGRIIHGKVKAPTSKVKPGLKAPQPRRHKKAKSIATMAVVSVLLCGYSSMMVMAGYTLQDVMGGMYSPFMAVSSQSMQPTLNYGDLIIVTREHAENIVVGDIVAFNVPSPYDRVAASPTVHRVVGKWVEDGVVYFKTIGDNNQGEDPWTIPEENVIGKCTWKVPYIGYVVLAIKTPLGLATAFSALLVWVLYPYVKRFLSVREGGVQHG